MRMSDEPLKKCRICKEDKPISKFPKCVSCKDGRNTFCRKCKRQLPYNKAYDKIWYKKNKHKRNLRRYERHFGLTANAFNNMLEAQGECCKICKRHQTALCVDHCHKTGMVRGLLCKHCNLMLGFSEDNPAHLQSGIEYLLSHYSGSLSVN